MASSKKKKGKGNTKAKRSNNKTWTLRDTFGEAGVGTFIAENMVDSDGLGKMVMLEPREWLDFACVGVTSLKDEYHAVYDLNVLEYVYALMLAYEDFHYRPNSVLLSSINKSLTEEHWDMAREWVDHNTVRGATYLKANQPLFVRSLDPNSLQFNWVT